jgi:hypothetical protein
MKRPVYMYLLTLLPNAFCHFQMVQTLLCVDEFSRITLYMAQLFSSPEPAKVNSTNRMN